MNFNNLNYFLIITEEGSISAAARKLFISQQSLSEQLRKMEDEVGTPLFYREKPLTLTPAGKVFYNGCKELIDVYSTTLNDIKDITALRRSHITVAIPTCYTPGYIEDFIIDFQTNHPEIELDIVKRQHSDIAHNMNGVDLYFSIQPLSNELENHVILESDLYYVVLQKELALKTYGDNWDSVEEKLKTHKDLKIVDNLPFIALKGRYNQISEDLRLIFNEKSMDPIFSMSSENIDIINNACVNGIGAIIIPETYLNYHLYENKKYNTDSLLAYPLEIKSFNPCMVISNIKGRRLHKEERLFIDEAKRFLAIKSL